MLTLDRMRWVLPPEFRKQRHPGPKRIESGLSPSSCQLFPVSKKWDLRRHSGEKLTETPPAIRHRNSATRRPVPGPPPSLLVRPRLGEKKNLDSSAAPFPARGRRCHLLRPPSRSCTRRGNAQAAQPFALDSGTPLHWPSMVALHRFYISAVACFAARETDVRRVGSSPPAPSIDLVDSSATPSPLFTSNGEDLSLPQPTSTSGPFLCCGNFVGDDGFPLKLRLRPLIFLAHPPVLRWFFSSVAVVQTEKPSPQLQALDFSSDLSSQPLLMVVAVVWGSTRNVAAFER